MPKIRKQKNADSIQTGRSLPPTVTQYSYSHRQASRRRPHVPAGSLPAPGKQPLTFGRILKRTMVSVLLVCVIAVAVLGLWDARNITSASKQLFGSGNLLSLLGSGSPKTDANGRVNVLITGYSVDDPGHPGATLTDSILVLSMNPANHTGYLLSVPRDLYVKIPGSDHTKINETYQDGGIGLLEQVISNDFNIQIGYYAIVDYGSVRDIVNALGGISVNIQSPDPRGLYDGNISPADGGPLKLSNGLQIIDGQTALNLTRARGDTYDSYGFPQSDFDRTQHQRQVFAAIKAKLNWKLILNPRQNGKILNAAADNIKTDVPAGQARALFGIFNGIPNSKLQSLSLRQLNGKNYLTSYTTYSGQSALVPSAGIDDYSQIQNALSQLN